MCVFSSIHTISLFSDCKFPTPSPSPHCRLGHALRAPGNHNNNNSLSLSFYSLSFLPPLFSLYFTHTQTHYCPSFTLLLACTASHSPLGNRSRLRSSLAHLSQEVALVSPNEINTTLRLQRATEKALLGTRMVAYCS